MAGPGWDVPDCRTLCRRQKTLSVQIPYRRADGPRNLSLTVRVSSFRAVASGKPASIVLRADAFAGGLEPVVLAGARSKVHLAMDAAPSEIRAVAFTPGGDGDSPVSPDPLDRIAESEDIGTVTADGAHDTRHCHTAIFDRQATRSSRSAGTGERGRRAARSQAPATKPCPPPGTPAGPSGSDGPNTPSEAQAKMRCLKAFGARIASVRHRRPDRWRPPDHKTAEIQIRIALIKRLNALGTAEVVRVA